MWLQIKCFEGRKQKKKMLLRTSKSGKKNKATRAMTHTCIRIHKQILLNVLYTANMHLCMSERERERGRNTQRERDIEKLKGTKSSSGKTFDVTICNSSRKCN